MNAHDYEDQGLIDYFHMYACTVLVVSKACAKLSNVRVGWDGQKLGRGGIIELGTPDASDRLLNCQLLGTTFRASGGSRI